MIRHIIDDAMAAHFILVATITALMSVIFTTAVSFFGIYGFSPLNALGAVLLFGLAFGMYTKKSRACGILLFASHLVGRFDMYEQTGSFYAAFGPVPMSIAWIYFLGVLGTLAVQAKKKEARSLASDLSPEAMYNETSS